MESDGYKVCSKCNEKKIITDFHVNSRDKNKHRSQCKLCINKAKTEWERNNKEKKREHDFRNRQRNPDKTKEKDLRRRRKYKENHSDYEALRFQESKKEITDRYVLKSICRDFNLKSADVPKELIESKRMQIKVKRLLKNKKDDNTETC